MMSKVPIKDHEGWYKDEQSGAIQCADTKRYQEYETISRFSRKGEAHGDFTNGSFYAKI